MQNKAPSTVGSSPRRPELASSIRKNDKVRQQLQAGHFHTAHGIPSDVQSPEHGPTRSDVSRECCLHCPDRVMAATSLREQAEHRTMETQLRSALARVKCLVQEKNAVIHNLKVVGQECDHRLLNNLQMVVSLLGLQSRTARNVEVASQLSIAANRVGAVARIHRHLHSMDGRQSIDFKQYLQDLCREYSAMLGSRERPDQAIVVEGVEIDLRTAVGIPLSLIVNELLTNAIKHGKGRIAVKLMSGPDNGHTISVTNDGMLAEGFDPAAATGMGMRLISSLVDQIGGELWIDRGEHNEGTRFLVSFN